MPLLAESFESLARRAVACKGWRWMPGMKTLAGWRVSSVPLPDMVVLKLSGYHDYTLPPDTVVERCREPDLSDPATLGCLLALVREAWADTHVSAGFRMFSMAPMVWVPSQNKYFHGSSEAEAMVAALEAAT